MNTADVAAEVKCLRRLIGMRLANVYDISPKTYLFKLMNSSGITESGESEKVLLLMESGVRLHTTAYVRDDYKGLTIMSRHRYPIEASRVFERTSFEKLQKALTCSNASGEENYDEPKVQDNSKNQRSTDSSKKVTLKVILGEALGYGPALSEHIILDAGLLPNMKVGNKNDSLISEETIQTLLQAVIKFEDWLADVISGQKIPEGYILMQNKPAGKNGALTSQEGLTDKFYDEFCPILLNQFKSREFMEFETFDAALDEFYSKIESQRSEQQQRAKEGSAVHKLNKIRLDQENRVESLKKEVDHCIRMAELIEYNLQDVDAAILAVRVALANGMDWEGLARMVKEEKKAGNPVAGLIDKLHLERNFITLLLSNNLDEMDEDEITRPVDKVEVDLALSAHANARRWYEAKKKQENKQEKTITAHEKAFKAAERKTRLQLSQEKTVAAITHMRKVHWFEKFNWFISSENYLVISGRDAQQNEMVVKRYMSKGDLYIHADLHGASSTVIKNHKPDHPVPPLTLNQAGCFTVCHSQAWDSKIVTSAWWVYPHQVSKTAPTGEYLTVGSFMIRGKKNFLPPHPLVMGFGILFRLDESSLASHINERRVRGEEEELPDMEEGESLKEEIDSESETGNEKVAEESKKSTRYTEFTDDQSNEQQNSGSDIAHSIDRGSVEDGTSSLDNTKYENISGAHDINEEPAISSQLDDLIDRVLGVGSARVPEKNLESDTQISSVGTHGSEENKGMVRDKPFISKAERSKLKKGQKSSSDGAAGEHENKEHERGVSSGAQSDKNEGNSKKSTAKITRGQRSKLKKIKEKYAEQDEEERKTRLALLASSGKPLKNGKDSHDTAGATASATRSVTDADTANMLADEEGIHEMGEDEKAKLNDIDYLTGNPLSDDVLLYAVPVCGPYNALQTYKYRVKITPGTAKKGKAAKTAMNLFNHIPEATVREKELMKACTDPELVAAIVGNVKITAPGLTQLKQKQKKGKKSGKVNN
ncbi:hypothetical protein QJS04_geneDACA004628 [Acorus gramineus]|uniref:Nuclear export mediator factor NEMF n=1 Tax=Acorus gramineus TaxID=55184 RepID=A0AAV9BV88_ACOGR|nr:hypothetical protein QJS04_geneDACA004628 [Acorus gramineus]